MKKVALPVSIPDGERKLKVLKAFIKPLEAAQRSAEIKILVNFYFDTVF